MPLIIAASPALMRTYADMNKSADATRLVSEPVELVDLFPTLCCMSGIEIPERVEGRDISKIILDGDRGDADRAVLCEEYYRRAIIHDNHKLVFDQRPGNEMLFDLNHGINTFNNVYDRPEYHEKRFDLKRRLLAFLCERIFGPYSSEDVDRIERALDPDDPRISLLATDLDESFAMHYHRAAVLLYHGPHTLLLPFYERRPVLFNSPFFYPSWDDAVEFDRQIAERLLDEALRTTMQSTLPASRLDVNHVLEPRPTRAQIQELYGTIS